MSERDEFEKWAEARQRDQERRVKLTHSQAVQIHFDWMQCLAQKRKARAEYRAAISKTTQSVLAKKYGINKRTLQRILKGEKRAQALLSFTRKVSQGRYLSSPRNG